LAESANQPLRLLTCLPTDVLEADLWPASMPQISITLLFTSGRSRMGTCNLERVSRSCNSPFSSNLRSVSSNVRTIRTEPFARVDSF